MRQMQSLYFEQAEIGMEFKTALSEPFTREMCEAFEMLTRDRAHTKDPTKPGFVQGNFIVSMTGGLLFDVGHFVDTIVVQTVKNTRFLRPLMLGQRLYAVEKIVRVEDMPGKPFGKVWFDRETFNDNDELILKTEQEYRIRKRG